MIARFEYKFIRVKGISLSGRLIIQLPFRWKRKTSGVSRKATLSGLLLLAPESSVALVELSLPLHCQVPNHLGGDTEQDKTDNELNMLAVEFVGHQPGTE